MTASLIFLTLTSEKDGSTVSGDALDHVFGGQIEVDSWGWELNDESRETASGSSAGVVPSQFKLSKFPDRATTRLLSALSSGEIFSTATLTMLERSELEPFQLVIDLTRARVLGYELNVTDGDTEVEMKEDWTFTYHEVTFTYYDQAVSGGNLDVVLTRPPGADLSESPLKAPSPAASELLKSLPKMSPEERAKLGKELDRYQPKLSSDERRKVRYELERLDRPGRGAR